MPPRTSLRVLVAAAVVLLCSAAAAAAAAAGGNLSSRADLAGLYSLRASLGLRARYWPRKADPCKAWAGVGCRGGRVVSLDLSGLRRTRIGRLSPRFAVDGLQNLSRLVSFNATGFLLPGSIPDWFGGRLAPTFAELVLVSADVTGDIPPTLGQLRSLVRLDISGNSLSGGIPADLGNLTSLQTLALVNNGLSGPVPVQLGNLTAITSLNLSNNSLSGELPDDLKNLRRLQDLNLADNSLSGALSPILFSNLSRLQTLILGRNNFSGELPNTLWSLSELRVLDVSGNNLTGSLPDLQPTIASNANTSSTLFDLSDNLYYGLIPNAFQRLLTKFSLANISSNYFNGSLALVNGSTTNVSFELNCFRNASDQRSPAECRQFYDKQGIRYDVPLALPRSAPAPQSESHGRKSHNKLKFILIGVIGGILLLIVILVIAVVFCCMFRGARRGEQRESTAETTPSGVGGGGTPPSAVSINLAAVGDSFAYEELVRATSGFGDESLIKHGHSGNLYRGALDNGSMVVVKQIDANTMKKDGYVVELDLFAKGLHERLVPFLGHCLSKENEKFLVYRFVPNGDLSSALHRKTGQEGEEGMSSLDWIKRLKIAMGVAEALCFLHHECTPPMVHRDVQASSILLDDKFEVRLGSLSEACIQEGEGHLNVITKLFRSSAASEQGASGSPSATCSYDIYCFGKVLLELVTGELGISGSNNATTSEWIERTLLYINIYEKELVTKIVDPSLIIDEDHLEEVWAMAIVAKSCLNPRPPKRPLMRYVLKALENPLKVVREEHNSSSARLRATSSRGSWNAAFFGSWRQSSSNIMSVSGPPRDDLTLKRSETIMSQGSNGEHSFNHHKRQSREIFPEPSGSCDIND